MWQQKTALVLLGLALVASYASAGNFTKEEQRKKKTLSVFNVVSFPNDPCMGSTGSKNGTCYTQDECESRGGTRSGSCAEGYGVCCVFTLGCGDRIAENCTFFEASAVSSAGSCRTQVCKCQSNICQIRLDFMTFTISQPSADTATVLGTVSGSAVIDNNGVLQDARTQCNVDVFTATSPGNNSPGPLCGTLTGEHMYLDASDSCNELAFQLGAAGTSSRSWSIKITQYACDSENLAPRGCTQWMFGSSTGTIQSYNFGNGNHLANQHQNICIRQERGNCQICYTTTTITDFAVSGTAASNVFNHMSKCCGYGTDGKQLVGFDCVQIPHGFTAISGSMVFHKQGANYCGTGKGLNLVGVTTSAAMPGTTVCSRRTPFRVTFLSDHYENDAELGDRGFRFAYTMSTC